jgi:glycosyltransferase involved in cell wall biosynthesis
MREQIDRLHPGSIFRVENPSPAMPTLEGDEVSDYILISAHHCAPGMGSEHAVGWNLVSRLARWHKLILITQDNEFRTPVEQAISALNASGCQIKVFFVRHGSSTDGRRNNLRLGYYLTYIAYQWRVYRLVLDLKKRYRISIVHHLTIVGFREPGFLWMLGIPFVWGPVGGLVYAPRNLLGELPFKTRVFQELRNGITWAQFQLSWRVRLAYQAAQSDCGQFIAATPDIGKNFQKRFGGNYIWIPETGSNISENVIMQRSISVQNRSKLKLLWVGALIDIKPLGLLLKSIAQVPDHNKRIELTVVGDGESRQLFADIAQNLNVQANFTGWLDQSETKKYYLKADLFILLSLKDLTTNVVFEALGNNLPVLCLDHHGYSHIIDDTCGIKITPDNAENIIRNIAETLHVLETDRGYLKRLAFGAMAKGCEFTWDRNAKRISDIYSKFQ